MRREKRGYVPCVGNNEGTLRQIVPFVEVVLGQPVWNVLWCSRQQGGRKGKIVAYVPRGTTGRQRIVSFKIASIYGNEDWSLKLGSRCDPTTWSSCLRAFSWTSGLRVIARKNVPNAETVWSKMSVNAFVASAQAKLTVSAPPASYLIMSTLPPPCACLGHKLRTHV